VEGRSHGPIEVPSRNFLGGTEENHMMFMRTSKEGPTQLRLNEILCGEKSSKKYATSVKVLFVKRKIIYLERSTTEEVDPSTRNSIKEVPCSNFDRDSDYPD
jgi:hypothetical protein